MDIISFLSLHQKREVTWALAGKVFSRVPVLACQKRMLRSLLPPPVAKMALAHGQKAMALTAAL